MRGRVVCEVVAARCDLLVAFLRSFAVSWSTPRLAEQAGSVEAAPLSDHTDVEGHARVGSINALVDKFQQDYVATRRSALSCTAGNGFPTS